MPYSSDLFDEQVKSLIAESDYQRFLDIGPGAGKYGTMIRALHPDTRITGIEAHAQYVSQFGLQRIYDEIHIEQAEEWLLKKPNAIWDMVILGDVIEHIPKSKGIDLLHFLVYRSKMIAVVYPTKYIQQASGGVVSEAHVSVWNEDDFGFVEYAYYEKDFMRLVVLKGYLDDPEAIRG